MPFREGDYLLGRFTAREHTVSDYHVVFARDFREINEQKYFGENRIVADIIALDGYALRIRTFEKIASNEQILSANRYQERVVVLHGQIANDFLESYDRWNGILLHKTRWSQK